MALTDNLAVQSLDFPEIKQNFIDFLKGDSNYQDFNFQASGIGTILNISAYQTHYLGFFVKMLLDESFIDSAHTKQALLSHAKKTGYIPKGYQAATAQVILSITTTTASEPSTHNIPIPRGSVFKAVNDAQDTRVFTVLDGTTIYNRSVSGNIVTYTSSPITIYEGTVENWNFVVDSSVINQLFVIKDEFIDIDTIRVKVYENSSSTSYTEFVLASDVLTLEKNSNVFFVSTDENGFYQIFFGNNVFGVQPGNGNWISVDYVSTNGVSGNGAKSFTFTPNSTMNFTGYSVTTQSISSGGAAPQSLEELRFAIPQANKRQKRTVTAGDYQSILLDDFRNIESINVWGGEQNTIRDYGKTYISVKPYYADTLTALAKQEISEKIAKKYGIVGSDVVFVDPDFINVELTVVTSLDLRATNKTQTEIFNMIQETVGDYNSNQLSKFGSALSDVDLMSKIKATDKSIVSVYSIKKISKNFDHLYSTTSSNNVTFGNPIVPGTLITSDITYGNLTVAVKDDGLGNLNVVRTDTNAKIVSAGSVNYSTGLVTYTLPVAARVAGYTGTYGRITWTASPQVPDIVTTLNNIVRINSVVVK